MTHLTQNQIEAQEVYAPTEEKRQTQCQRVLDYIDRFGGITSNGALYAFGCARLASRICDIEARTGLKFKRTREQVATRLGGKASVVRYSCDEGLTVRDYRTMLLHGKRYEKVDLTNGRTAV